MDRVRLKTRDKYPFRLIPYNTDSQKDALKCKGLMWLRTELTPDSLRDSTRLTSFSSYLEYEPNKLLLHNAALKGLPMTSTLNECAHSLS
jgi:hypothetical protein